jgi:hypothetical protein
MEICNTAIRRSQEIRVDELAPKDIENPYGFLNGNVLQ